jgi:predicted transcriptional regulator
MRDDRRRKAIEDLARPYRQGSTRRVPEDEQAAMLEAQRHHGATAEELAECFDRDVRTVRKNLKTAEEREQKERFSTVTLPSRQRLFDAHHAELEEAIERIRANLRRLGESGLGSLSLLEPDVSHENWFENEQAFMTKSLGEHLGRQPAWSGFVGWKDRFHEHVRAILELVEELEWVVDEFKAGAATDVLSTFARSVYGEALSEGAREPGRDQYEVEPNREQDGRTRSLSVGGLVVATSDSDEELSQVTAFHKGLVQALRTSEEMSEIHEEANLLYRERWQLSMDLGTLAGWGFVDQPCYICRRFRD